MWKEQVASYPMLRFGLNQRPSRPLETLQQNLGSELNFALRPCQIIVVKPTHAVAVVVKSAHLPNDRIGISKLKIQIKN